MASFDLGFDVAAPPEISPEDADILNDIFSQDIVFEEVVMSTSTYEAQQELDKAFSEDRKENFAPPKVEISQKRFKSVTESELKELEDKRQSEATKKSTKWGVKLFQGMFEDLKLGLKNYY